ncbi:MAG: DUF3035 domain-containing protein [Alphaproteobacteria bacterium]|nr:DUF3035 domain-containing protein [Alphaproteobacteria bacterium]
MNKILLSFVVLLVLSACGTLNKEKLGMVNKAPDETMVSTRKPLSLPPEYDLRPLVEQKTSKEINSLSELVDYN